MSGTLKIKKGEKRPSWEEVWFNITNVIKKRSVCLYYKVGAVIVKDTRLISMGYNGPPRGVVHCSDVGCARIIKGQTKKQSGLCRGAHAEINAIANAAYLGISINGSDMYVTYRPCAICTKTIINSGITRVFYLKEYQGDQNAINYFKEGNVQIKKVEFIK